MINSVVHHFIISYYSLQLYSHKAFYKADVVCRNTDKDFLMKKQQFLQAEGAIYAHQPRVLTLGSRKQGFTLSFCLSQFSRPQQNLSKVFLGHVSVGWINILTLKKKNNSEQSDEVHIIIKREIPTVGRWEQENKK